MTDKDWMEEFARAREQAAQDVREMGAKAQDKDYETLNLAIGALERLLNERCKGLEDSGMALSVSGMRAKVSRNPESSQEREMLEVQVFFDERTASGRRKKSFASLGLVDKGLLMQGDRVWGRLAELLAARDAMASNGAESAVAVAVNERVQIERAAMKAADLPKKAPKVKSV